MLKMSNIKLGILSDTHGDFQTSYRAVEMMGGIDYLLHAGDYITDAEDLARCLSVPVFSVLGNCDFGRLGSVEKLFELGGYRIWLTHGHLYGVKSGLQKLSRQAKKYGVHLVVYGHTHLADYQEIAGISYFNPGSIGASWGSQCASCGVIRLERLKGMKLNIIYLNGENEF